MTELQTYQRDPNDELLSLGPADEDVMHWRAVMKGVSGTAYEGIAPHNPISTAYHLTPSLARKTSTTNSHRRHLAPRHPHPRHVPQLPALNPLRNAHLPPQRRLQDGRDLPRPAEDELVACVHDCHHHDERAPAADQRGAR